jgi:hypothetical protein
VCEARRRLGDPEKGESSELEAVTRKKSGEDTAGSEV